MSVLTFIILSLEGAILSFNVAACAALVPSIAADFNISSFVAGRIIWVYMLPYGIAALLYGPLVRRFDAKKIELVCISLFSLSNLLAALSVNVFTLFLGRFLMGVFGASVIPLGIILIAQHIEQRKRGRYIGVFFGTTFFASLLGLLLSGIMPWRYIFLIPAVCGLFLCILMILFLPNFRPEGAAFRINYLETFRDKRVICIFTYIFLASMLYHGIQQWLGVHFAAKYKLSQFIISMLITLTSLSGIFGEVLGGYLSDSLGRVKAVNLGIILMLLSVFTLLFKMPLFLLGCLMVVWGLGWAFNHAGLATLLTDLPRKFLNEAASLNSGVRFISGGLGAALAGTLMQRSFNLGFMVFGALLLALFIFTPPLLSRDTQQINREGVPI